LGGFAAVVNFGREYHMRLHYLFIWITVAILVTSCSQVDKEAGSVSDERYAFRTLHNLEVTKGLAIAGLGVPSVDKVMELGSSGRYAEYMAAFRGALLQLFGEPLETSDSAREAYSYLIEATDQQGGKWMLMPSQGAFGPQILGDPQDQSLKPVAEALLHLIETTKPADFLAVIYDDNADNTSAYGCRDGMCYWHEVSGNHLH
jgi:hypothetical protein